MKLARPITLAAISVAAAVAGGCAVAKSPSGKYVLGIGVATEPGSVQAATEGVGAVLQAAGVPWGATIGTAAGGILAAMGWGAARARKAQRDGERAGWDEAIMASTTSKDG